MPKGFYSQGLCILLSEPVSLDEMERALSKSGLKVSGRQDGRDDELIDVPSLIMPYEQGDDGQLIWLEGMAEAIVQRGTERDVSTLLLIDILIILPERGIGLGFSA